MIVMLMFLSVVSIAFADSTYPNYQWRYRMQIQQQGDQNAQVGAIQRVLHQLNYGINVEFWQYYQSEGKVIPDKFFFNR